MNKKLCAVALAAAIALSFSACAADSSGETGTAAPSQSQTTVPSQATTAPADVTVFEETVIVDDEDILFKITGIENDPIWGYTLKAQIENRSDKDLMFSMSDVSVNGYMCDPYFAATVTAGMKANEEISFSKDSFEEIGIVDVTDIAFELRVYDSNDLTADEIVEENFVIYPMGKEAAREYPRQSQEGDIVLFDTEDCTMIITGFDPDDIWGYSAKVYLVNKTDENLMFSVGDAAVNGYMCNPYFAKTVSSGKQCITSISWTENELANSGITEVESISLPIRVYNSEDWSKKDLINETFTVEP